MTSVPDYARHSRYTDPGPYRHLLEALPTDVRELAAVVYKVVVHFKGREFPPERFGEIDHRWLERLLATDQDRFGTPLAAPRPRAERVVGCCRDHTLLAVAALRQHGIRARSRVGFAGYFAAGFHHDHAITEYWNGQRWVFVDTDIWPGPQWPPFDACDIPVQLGPDAPVPAHFTTAAQAWAAYRAGRIDPDRYGVDPQLPFKGVKFLQDEVLLELAHRQRDEVLLWDTWGPMLAEPEGSVDLVDEVAALLLAADAGADAAERELAARYASDPRLHPGDRVYCQSPSGTTGWVQLTSSQPSPAAETPTTRVSPRLSTA